MSVAKGKKNPQNSKPCKGSEEGWERLPQAEKTCNTQYLCSEEVAKRFTAGYDSLWSAFMVFIEGRCTLSKMDMHDSDFKKC